MPRHPELCKAFEGYPFSGRFREAGIDSGERLEQLVYRTQGFSFRLEFPDGRVTQAITIPGHHVSRPQEPGPQFTGSVMLVGKVPGHEEAQVNLNFVGRSGDVLFNSLREVGFRPSDWQEWYLCNACRYVLDHDIRSLIKKDAYRDFDPVLLYEILCIRPRLIVCLGSEAARSILGKSKAPSKTLGATFNQTFTVGDLSHSCPVIVLTHPAAVLHNESARVLFLAGCRFLKQVLDDSASSTRPHQSYGKILVDSADKLDAFLADIRQSDVVAMDLEWSGNHPWSDGSRIRLFAFYTDSDRAWALPGPGEIDSIDQTMVDAAVVSALAHIRDNGTVLVGHNFRADLHWLVEKGYLREEDIPRLNLADTMLAIHAVYESGHFDLKRAAAVYCGIPSWTTGLEEWKARNRKQLVEGSGDQKTDLYSKVPVKILYEYACGDVYATMALYRHFFTGNPPLLERDEYGLSSWRAYDIDMSAQLALLRMERCGIGVDMERMRDLREAFERAEARILHELRNTLNWPDFNPRSTRQVSQALFGQPGTGTPNYQALEVVERTDQGAPSTSKGVLGILAAQGNGVASLLLDYRYVDQALKMYLDQSGQRGLYRHIIRGRIYPTFLQTVETGRYACTRPNLQNISNQREDDYRRILGDEYVGPIRSIFAAPPGYKILEVDLKGAELCVLAWLSQDRTMIEHISRSFLPSDHPDYYDIHSAITVKAFRLNCAPRKKDLEAIGASHLRVAAKSIVFGRAYDRSAEAILDQLKSMGMDVTLDDVKALINEFDSTYPQAIAYLESLARRVENPGYIIAPSGRIRRFRNLSMGDQQSVDHARREARNFPIQCGVADTMTALLVEMDRLIREEHLDDVVRIVLQIHDALLFEVHDDAVQMVVDIVRYLLRNQCRFYVSDPDGKPLLDRDGNPISYYFEADAHAYQNWYEELPEPIAG